LLVIGIAVTGNAIANQAYYFAVRTRGRDWLEKRFRERPKFRNVLATVSRHTYWMLLASPREYG
jgi:uncharacterized membrane protein YdjX (TVP38/TMEM64 family)